MVKKVFGKILNILSVAIIVLAIVLLVSVVTTPKGTAPSIFGYSGYRVITGSMEPAIPTDSLVITKKADLSSIAAGDIISFRSRDPQIDGAVNTHRVTDARLDNGTYIFTTKGDANLLEDQYPVYGSDVLGKVVYSSLIIGKIIRLGANPLIFGLLIIIPLLVIIVINIRNLVVSAKMLADAEVKEAIEAMEKEKNQKDGE